MPKRHVFYIHGFDPRGKRHYRELFSKSLRTWAEQTQTPLTITSTPTAWVAQTPDMETHLTYLGWDDHIRPKWADMETHLYTNSLKTLLSHLQSGMLKKVGSSSKPFLLSMISTIFPILLQLLGTLLFVVFATLALFTLVPLWFGVLSMAMSLALIFLPPPGFFKRFIERIHSGWTARILLYGNTFAATSGQDLKDKINAFAQAVIEALEGDDVDDVVLIGHSFGGVIAPMVAARVASLRPNLTQDKTQFVLLTLGSILPLITLHPKGAFYKDTLETLAQKDIGWIDISSPRDGACFALVNPYRTLQMDQAGPKILNAQFHKAYTPQTLQAGIDVPLVGHFYYQTCPDIHPLVSSLWSFPATLMDTTSPWVRYLSRPSQTLAKT